MPANQRAGCLIVTDNYGECGAINYWGLPEGIRPAVSGHNSCFSWWPTDIKPTVVLLVGMSREHAEQDFTSVTPGATRRSKLAMPYEQEITVWICRGWKVDPEVVRQEERSFI